MICSLLLYLLHVCTNTESNNKNWRKYENNDSNYFFFFTKKSCFENKDRVFCITQNIWKKLGTHVYLILYVYQILKYPSTESFEKNVIWNKKKMNHLNKSNTTLVLQLIAILFKLRCIQIQIWIYTQNGMKQIKILWIHFEFVAVNFHGLSVFFFFLGM